MTTIGTTSIDVNGIVSQLMAVENKALTKYDNKIADTQSKISAYGMIMSQMSNFQMSLQPLNNLNTNTAKSDSDTVSVSLDSSSKSIAYGQYAVNVSQLAQSQRLTLSNIASKDTVIGTGTLNFSFGEETSLGFTVNSDKPTKSITIDSSNNTLEGIKDAINSANMGVNANVINTGSGYTLSLTSETGAKNAMKISVSDSDGNSTDTSGLSQLAYDPAGTKNLTRLQSAQNALATFDGVAIQSTNNQFTTVDGATITANKVGNATVSVNKDSSGVSNAVGAFVKAYNDLNSSIKRLSGYDPTTKKGGILIGDATTRELQTKMRQAIFQEVGEVGSGQTLSTIGISFQKDGSLSLDTAKLNNALSQNPTKVMQMLNKSGQIVDKTIFIQGVTDKTKPGNYSIAIDQLATQANISGGSAISSLTIDSSNNTLGVEINGEQAQITLDSKTYSSYSELSSAIQSKLNSTLQSNKVEVALDASNKLSIKAKNYGSDQIIKLLPSNSTSTLFGSATENVGLDAKGSIGGISVTGKGQVLTGASNSDIDGLSLTVTGGDVGNRGMLYISKGMYGLFNDLTQSIEDQTLSNKKDSLNSQISSLTKARTAQADRLALVEKRYKAQFTSLDSMLSSLSATSSYLTTQLAKLS